MMPDEILALDAASLHDAYSRQALCPIVVAEATLEAAAIAGRRFNAITSLNTEDALASARASAARWKLGEPLGPLDGVPMTFKDSFNIAGLPRWHGSKVNPGAISVNDAAPVRRAREAGIVIIAKTAMPDYGLLMSGLSSQSGVVRNPWDPTTNPSGSSAGAAACLAAGVGPLALGTDMVGSVRLPAAMCGLVALYPTQGRVAYDPPGAYRGAGPMARSIRDLVSLLEVVGQYDAADHYALPGRFTPLAAPLGRLEGMKVGVLTSLSYGDAVDEETSQAVAQQAAILSSRGAQIEHLPDLDVSSEDFDAVYWTMVHKGATELYSAPEGRRDLILPEIGAMCEPTLAQSALFMNRQAKRIAAAVARLEAQFAPYDYILSPALPVRSFPAEKMSPDPGNNPMSHMGFACWFNQLGRPAGTVPVRAFSGGCPVSVQIAGRRFDDAGVLALLGLMEGERGFDIAFPTIQDVSYP